MLLREIGQARRVGVRKARGPPGRSLSLLYSLHGGARVIRLTMPDQEMRVSSKQVVEYVAL